MRREQPLTIIGDENPLPGQTDPINDVGSGTTERSERHGGFFDLDVHGPDHGDEIVIARSMLRNMHNYVSR